MIDANRLSVLTVNAGGSSIKFHYFFDGNVELWCSLTHLDTAHPRFVCSWDIVGEQVFSGAFVDHTAADFIIDRLDRHLRSVGLGPPSIISHRVKFAGEPQRPCVVDARLIDRLRSERLLSALHNPIVLALMEQAIRTFEDARHIGVFDNELFAEPWARHRLAPFAPRIMARFELFRDGHHGLAAEDVLEQLDPGPADRTIVIHLGSGSSVSAFVGRQPAYCSMGYASFDGPVMNSRSGTATAGLAVKLLSRGATPMRVSDLLHTHSGIFAWAKQDLADRGLIKEILPSLFGPAPRNEYTATIVCEVVFATTSTNGCDTIIFSGGLSRSSPENVNQIASYLAALGITPRSPPSRRVPLAMTLHPGVYVCHEREELVLLRKAITCKDQESDVLDAICVVPGKVVGTLTMDRNVQPSDQPWIRWLPNLTTEEALHSRHFAAIVAASGDRLGHGAAIARELMLTAVICDGIDPNDWEGSLISVDATEGRVRRC